MAVGPRGGQVFPGLHDEGLVNSGITPAQDRLSGVGGMSDSPFSFIVKGLTPLTISGVTRDANNNPLGNCVVHLFEASSDLEIAQTTSDGSGNFSLPFAWPEYTYYLVAYKTGSPDVLGTTVNTLVGS